MSNYPEVQLPCIEPYFENSKTLEMKPLICIFSLFLQKTRNAAALLFTILICSLLLTNSLYGQSNVKLQQIKPKWNLGDQKMVHTTSGTKIFKKDSLINTAEATARYSIKVIDTVNYYTLLYSNEPNSIDISTNPNIPKVDSFVNILTDIIKKIEKETNSFKYELQVDKSTGQAIKVKNSDEFIKMTELATIRIIDELGEKIRKPNIPVDSIKQKVIANFKLSESKILETVTNQFNYLMQPYSYEFPYNSTITQKTMVHDVNALGEFGGIEMPAMITLSSKQHNNKLTIFSDTEYDKDFLLELIKKKYKDAGNLTTSDISLNEKVETIFSTKNSWIVSHLSDIIFIVEDVKIVNHTFISFQ